MSTDPDDELFINSISFAQRNLVLSDGGAIGVDSWGQSRSGGTWRQTAALGEGARYRGVTPESTRIFDEVVNSVCIVPYPSKR
jgi:hypothetical protein